MGVAGWEGVEVPGQGVCFVIGKGVDMGKQGFNVLDGDGEVESLHVSGAHVNNADNLAAAVKERSAGVAGVNGGVDLQKYFTGEIPSGVADYAFGNRAFQSQGVTDHKDFFSHGNAVAGAEYHGAGVGAEFFHLKYRQVMKGVQCHDADIFMDHPFKFAVIFLKPGNINMFLALDDMEIGNDIALLVDQEAGP